ncbi:YIP1 family protein [Bacillus thermocopriae]|uniref:YIP1 family protein n=1 Tax=Neobacillus thermocopriae TaxID=1215031 RepID=A0A6B3TTC4_9BACI|nr:Yip1 family protein [Neobacillus thermocopriae]MED3623157.1 Yip1 family protein [Neobacillus thermocopriae]MED3715052.1 Yip1 family protein [Neobacillus thermocopriae]NEX79740.1 YIP1 family protein [Neobacillus thermocopriae]
MEVQTELKKENPSLLGMFTSPGEQFERIKVNPKIWMPLLIVSILYGIGSTLMALSMDVGTLIDQGVPEDQAEFLLGFTKITTSITGFFTPIIGVLISSAIYLLVAKIAGASVTFKQLFSMNTFIMVISGIGLVLNMAIIYLINGNPDIFITSLAGVFNQEKTGLLSSLEIFGIWSTILTAIGLHKTANFSKGLAWTIAIIFFLISLGFGLIGSMFNGIAQ